MTASITEKSAVVRKTTNRLKGATIGELIDQLHDIRESKRALDAQVKTVEAKYAEVETQLMDLLEAQDTDRGSGKKASVSVTSSVVAQVEDWDALYKYVKRTGYFHLFQRRVSDPACRELFEKKGSIPGVVPFTRKKLNLRSN